MNIIELYRQRFLEEIEKYSGSNKILILLGADRKVDLKIDESHFADFQTFYDEKGEDYFDKIWFAKVFGMLNASDDIKIISYAQFTYLTKYISIDFFGERFTLIQDNLRGIFPIQESEYVKTENTRENIETRPEGLPVHHSEQLKWNGQFYYVLQTGSEQIENTSLFCKRKKLIPISSDNLKILDIGTDKFSIDLFVNELLEKGEKYKSIALKIHKKHPVDVDQYERLAYFLNQIDIRLYSFEEEIIVPKLSIGEDVHALLAKHWGANAEFRNIKVYKNPNTSKEVVSVSQGTVVQTIINEIKAAELKQPCRDLFLTAPTGSGKSLLFQLPAFYASRCGLMTIVVSPLIALMKDQVGAIHRERSFEKVAYLNSELTLVDREKVLEQCHKGNIDILYLSPELLLSYDLKHFTGERKLGLMVIDEAHLITTWGRDFRVDYWFLGNHLQKVKKFNSLDFPIVAVTATAIFGGDNDMVFDSIDNLYMTDPHLFIGEVKRTDIEFLVNNYADFDTKYEKKKLEQTAQFIRDVLSRTNFKTLVYTPYTKHVRQLVQLLDSEGYEVKGYYGALDKDLKQYSYDQFLSGKVRVMISTKAFGMGVDISDIQVVYHHAPSGLLPDYVQEVGRLAREKHLRGYAALNYSKKDQRFSKALHGMSSLRHYQLRLILEKIFKTYESKKTRNLLLSVEDFAFIFNEHDDLDQKVLTSLMMIEKDYLAKNRFNVIVARPKKLFVKVFGKVKAEHFGKLDAKYGQYFREVTRRTQGDVIIELALDQIWERFFEMKSFPSVKRDFYQKKIFSKDSIEIEPQIKAEYKLLVSGEDAAVKFKYYLDLLKKIFSGQKSYFTSEMFKHELNEKLQNHELTLKLSNFLLSTYSGGLVRPGVLETDAFLQKRRIGSRTEYMVFSSRYLNEFASLEKLFHALFRDERQAIRYLTKDASSAQKFSRLGYFLELLDLGSFEIKGGDMPMVFIRLNDPSRIGRDSKYLNYENTILTKTLNRHKISSRIFDHFFLRKFDNHQRWNFIEDYFLGANPETLLDDYPGEQNEPIDLVNELEKRNGDTPQSKESISSKKNSTLDLFPPDKNVWYGMQNLITIDVDGTSITKKVTKWLTDDIVNFALTVKEHDLKLDSLVYKTMMTKLRKSHESTYRGILGLNVHIHFPGYPKTVRASVPYKEDPVKFYKWWVANIDEVQLSFKEKIQLFVEVEKLSPQALLPKHRNKIS